MTKWIPVIIVILFFIGCNNDNCSKNLKYIELNYYLFEDIRVDGDTYCDLVNKSFSGDRKSIIELSKIEVSDGTTYEHGAVLLEVIDNISEIEYVDIINQYNLTKNEKIHLLSNLNAGLDYTKNENWYKISSINLLYPNLYKILSSY